MKTSELTGAPLDYWVAKAEGFQFDGGPKEGEVIGRVYLAAPPPFTDKIIYEPSTNWAQGGPIIERERIAISLPHDPGEWVAQDFDGFDHHGPTPLIAAMRAYVASKFGDEVVDYLTVSASA